MRLPQKNFESIQMAQSQPYQPLAFRILHGAIAALIIIAILTGVVIYNVYDGRIGHLPIPVVPKIMGIHKLFGRAFLLAMPFFALYSFDAGRRRLIQENLIKQIQAVGKPIWWYTLHRITNTLLLLTATFALVSGREMDEGWMSRGELTHVWYSLHLVSWVAIFACLATHLLMSARVGGIPLLLSILNLGHRTNDNPSILIKIIQSWLNPQRLINWIKKHILFQKQNPILLIIEILIMGGIAFSWISLIPHRG